MTRRLMLALALAACAAACGRGDGGDGAPAPAGSPEAPEAPSGAPIAGEPPLPQRAATYLWPGTDAAALQPREGLVLSTGDPADEVRQVVGVLLAPPPDATVVAPFPAGTRLLAAFVDERGNAYVSLSREANSGAPGGSAWERLAVHSLVGSVTRSVPRVRRVQLLVEGREIETLAGHLDLRAPVTFDESLLGP